MLADGWAQSWQSFGATIGVVGIILGVLRNREIRAFLGSHASKGLQILRLESENATLRSSLASAHLANEAWQDRVTQMEATIEENTRATADLRTEFTARFDILSAKFIAGVGLIGNMYLNDHGTLPELPAIIHDEIMLEVKRQQQMKSGSAPS